MFNKRWNSKLKSLFEKRQPLSKPKFVEEMVLKGHDRVLTEIVYDGIKDYLPKSINSIIYPSDDILQDYEIDDEDLGDIMIRIFKGLNIKFPTREEQERFYDDFGQKVTVERMVQFVEFYNKSQN